MIQENRTSLEAEILKTIAFFDLFDYPLTSFEIWQYLGIKTGLKEVLSSLENKDSCLYRALGRSNGFYFVSGRSQLCQHRQETCFRISSANKSALAAFKFLKLLSSVELLAVCNNFYYTPDSDIDVFVVTSRKRLWSTRLLVTLITHLMGRRRYGKKVVGRLCLSFYVSSESLNLEPLTLPDDPYFYYWLAFIEPLYDSNAFHSFWQANAWLASKLPNLKKAEPLAWQKLNPNKGFLADFRKHINSGLIGDLIEKLTRRLQKDRMSHNRSSLASQPDTRVVISDTVLKFHEGDRRELFLKRLQERWQQLLSL
jgi:hypothetical protein